MTQSLNKTVLVFLATTVFSLAAVRAEAQFPLSPALWQESISLEVQTIQQDMTSFTGSDPMVPEPRTEQLTGTGYDVSGSVQFGTTVAPVGTAEVTWDVGAGGASLDLRSSVDIDFQARVIETSTPPVSVTEVPVTIQASGSVSVVQFFGPRATSFFRFQVPTTTVLFSQMLDLYGDPDSTKTADSFEIDETAMIPPDLVALVSMTATASMGTVGTGGTAVGSAVGMIDPVIEVADQIIPGTSDSYRDYYTIEFSEGYDAQTPVRQTTFGRIKAMYGDRN